MLLRIKGFTRKKKAALAAPNTQHKKNTRVLRIATFRRGLQR